MTGSKAGAIRPNFYKMINQLYLKPEEGKFLALATIAFITDLEEGRSEQKYNWTPETRKLMREMMEARQSLRIKLTKLGFNMTDLGAFREGDQDEFLTKPS